MKYKQLFFLILICFASIKTYAFQPPIEVGPKGQEDLGVIINPKSQTTLKFRFKVKYAVYNSSGKIMLKGEGKQMDVTKLKPGSYTIKFNNNNNMVELYNKLPGKKEVKTN